MTSEIRLFFPGSDRFSIAIRNLWFGFFVEIAEIGRSVPSLSKGKPQVSFPWFRYVLYLRPGGHQGPQEPFCFQDFRAVGFRKKTHPVLVACCLLPARTMAWTRRTSRPESVRRKLPLRRPFTCFPRPAGLLACWGFFAYR
jgi:hypothetical protein